MVGEQLQHFVETPGLPDEADGSMQREIKSLLAVYRLAETPQWAAATALLAQSRKVQIAGFQTERGIAMMLANHLQFMRDGVQLVDLTAGNYADVFATSSEERRGGEGCVSTCKSRWSPVQ